jgi:hypothetical protein
MQIYVCVICVGIGTYYDDEIVFLVMCRYLKVEVSIFVSNC